jgi:hypothetical protein
MNVKKNIFKSIAAVFAGAIVSVVLSVGTDAVMRAVGIFPQDDRPMSDALFALATLYRTIYGVLGAYVTARLAPHRPMMHALVLGAIGVVASTAGAIAMWSKLPAMGPKWYPLLLIALALPPAWLGGKLRLMQLDERGRL